MPGSTGAGQPGVTGGSGGLYQWIPPNPLGVAPPVAVPPHRHHGHHGFDGLGEFGAFDPLGIGIDFSNPLVIGIGLLAVYLIFFHKKGRR